jgi:hypothetical protein
VGHHDPADIAGLDAESFQLRADLLLRLDPFAERTQAGMPAREVAPLGGAGVLARVDDDHALGVLDREGVDRKRLRPLAVDDRVQQAAFTVADALAPSAGDGDGSCLDWIFIFAAPFVP